MKKMFKRAIALLSAASLMLSIAACAPNGNTGGTVSEDGKSKLSAIVGSHVSWPYNENWVIWDYIEEAANVDLELTAIPGSDLSTKLPLMMASPEKFPDMMHTWMKETVDDYALSGAYMCFEDYLDIMPNYSKFLESLDETEYKELTAQHTSGDGKMYSAIATGRTGASGYTWMYRKDVFDKHGLQVPTTAEELYQVAKKLKELYPDSYPLCFRDGLGKLIVWGPAWQDDFTFRVYYDYAKGEWKYGAREPVAREMVEYFLKLKNEGLVPPDYITMPTKSWEELMTTDCGFITMDYLVRIDFFNNASRVENPEYTMALMAPPVPATEGGEARVMKSNIDLSGYCVFNTGDNARTENAFKFIDWMYSDEAYDLLSWGKEGETYTVDDSGARKFILTGDETPQMKFGIGTYGTYQKADPAANEESYSAEQVAAFREVEKYHEEFVNPESWITFSEEEADALAAVREDVNSYAEEGLSMFMLGQRPISEWDSFVAGLNEMGVDTMLEIYKTAFDRATKN